MAIKLVPPQDGQEYRVGQQYQLTGSLKLRRSPFRQGDLNLIRLLDDMEIVALKDTQFHVSDDGITWMKIYCLRDKCVGWVPANAKYWKKGPGFSEDLRDKPLSMEEQNKKIQEWLKQLDDRKQTLRNSHQSVRISFQQMLAYVDQIRESLGRSDADERAKQNPQEISTDISEETSQAIHDLLRTYTQMAERFYTQFEFSVLDELQKEDQLRELLGKFAFRQLHDDDVDLLVAESRDAAETLNSLRVRYPKLLQDGLNKLGEEWQRIHTTVAGSRLLQAFNPLSAALRIVVETVAYSVGIEGQRIIIVPGPSFSLSFFKYLNRFAVLTIPFNSVLAPWDWTIFWHELAGYQVREVERGPILEKIAAKMTQFHTKYKEAENEAEKEALLEPITRNNPFGRAYLKDILEDEPPDLSELGNFEYQFERVLAKLPEKGKFQTYDMIRQMGWSANWLKELFEDAFSVLAIGDKFLPLFDNILMRHGVSDDRHPPFSIRKRFAERLLHVRYEDERNSRGETNTLEDLQELMIELVARQILKFVPLVNSAYHIFPTQNQRPGEDLRKTLLDLVGQAVEKSIDVWTGAMNQAETAEIGDENERAIEAFLTASRPYWKQLSQYLGKHEPQDEEMIREKDYQELLALSFYDIDFGFSGPLYRFYHKEIGYLITEANLQTCTGTYIFTGRVENGFQILNLYRPPELISYWTTDANLGTMKSNNMIWIG